MNIYANGRPCELPGPVSLEEALRIIGVVAAEVAVAINQEFVPRRSYPHVQLRPDDRLEIVSPMAGG